MKWCTVLVCVVLGAFIVMAGDAIPGIGHLHSTSGKTHAAAADTIEKDKVKEKIKETEEEPEKIIEKIKKKRGRPERKTEETRYEEVSEEKPSFWGSCLGDLLGSICSGAISSAFGGDEEEPALDVELEEPVTVGDVTTGAPSESGTGAGGVDSPDTLPYTATVMPLSMGETAVLLWDRPGGEAMQATVLDTLELATALDTLVHATVLDTLELGVEVKVVGITRVQDTYWVKIETMHEPKITGWINEMETAPIEMPSIRK